MKIIKDNNPERIGTYIKDNRFLVMLQIEENNSCNVTLSLNTKKDKEKVRTLYSGDIEDFCLEYKGMEEHEQLNSEKAFINFLTNKKLIAQ